jgi:hypothetical protein
VGCSAEDEQLYSLSKPEVIGQLLSVFASPVVSVELDVCRVIVKLFYGRNLASERYSNLSLMAADRIRLRQFHARRYTDHFTMPLLESETISPKALQYWEIDSVGEITH